MAVMWALIGMGAWLLIGIISVLILWWVDPTDSIEPQIVATGMLLGPVTLIMMIIAAISIYKSRKSE